ncbi:hypothetical protein ACF1BQ_040345 [Bradyrhizobium sp. RDT10]
MNRRQLLTGAAGVAVGAALPIPAIAQTRTKLRLGYLHVVAVDGQILTGLDRGSFEKRGIEFELLEFNTGPEVFAAMAEGASTCCRRAASSPTISRLAPAAPS